MDEQLGSYRLLERLGQGGMAVVYRGEKTGEVGFKKRVAIKRMLPQYRRDPSLLERFAAEARTNARLDHPNLVSVLDFGVEPEPFLVLEYVDGVSLSQLMQRAVERHESIDIAAAIFIAAEVASGLDHAHRKRGDDDRPLGIVHRDVSPQNVLLSNEGSVKVSDFGLVKAADNVLKTASGMAIGKISYMAPEQAAGEEIDARADIFALGVTLWEMLTLRSLIPPQDPTAAIQLIKRAEWEPASRFNPKVSPRLDAIVLAALRGSPRERTPSAQQLAIELRELLHEEAPGYGRQELARLVQWMFRERGWSLPAPSETAQQPSPEERASIHVPTPAVEAIARAERSARSLPPPAPTRPRATASTSDETLRLPAPRRPRAAWIGIAAVAAAVLLATILVAAGVAGLLWYRTRHQSSITLACGAPECRLYIGHDELGPSPVTLEASALDGRPVVAVAPGYEPMIARPERLASMVRRGEPSFVITLVETATPGKVVYVEYEGEAIVELGDGRPIGEAPGAIILPHDGAATIILRDAHDGRAGSYAVPSCAPNAICLMHARRATTY